MSGDLQDKRLSALIDAGLALGAELDLDVLLQKIADIARRVIDATYAAVGVLGEDGSLTKFFHSGMPQEVVDKIGRLPEGRGVLGVLIEEGRPLKLRDISAHPRSYGFPAAHPQMRSFLGVPIVSRGRVFGRLYMTEKLGAEEFSEEDVALATALAAQAGVAVENARLYSQVQARSEELAHRLAELSSVEVIGKLLLSGSTTDRMLESVAEQARVLTRASRAIVLLADEDTSDLVVRVAAGDGKIRDATQTRVAKGMTKAGAVMARQKSEIVEDLSKDPEVHPRAWADLGSAISGAFAPLMIKQESVGVLAVYDRRDRGPFSRDDLTILEILGAMAAIALENERLNAALRDMAVLEERERISKELHDGVIQAIYAVGLSLQGSVALMQRDSDAAKGRIEQAISQLDDVVRDVRSYIFELKPQLVQEVGMAEAIRGLVRELEVNTLIHGHVDLHEDACGALREDDQVHVVQIVREVLSNIARHAEASEIRLSCLKDETGVVLSIEDDGKGFDPESASAGHGLRNMRDRAAQLGGLLIIQPRDPKGSVHRLLLPEEKLA